MQEKEIDFKGEEIKKIEDDWIFADLHIHSKYSRACSKELDFPNLSKWAKIKGLSLLGTGDFTHPKWLDEIKKLKEEDGVYYYEESSPSSPAQSLPRPPPEEIQTPNRFPFILTSEISLIYTHNGKGRKIHLVYFAPSIEVVEKINSWLDSKGRRDYDGRPIFGMSCRDFVAKMEEIDKRIEVIPAHIWTPWFGLYGSEGGFDKLNDAFLDKSYLIHAIETGISSDPEMNWKIKDIDDRAILSFSDAHSFWPFRIGREATIFKKLPNGKITYDEIIRQIREKDFIGTIETDPAYGKYHFDGHRNCNFSSQAEETKKLNGICPKCGKPMVVGVEYRVNEISKIAESNHNKKKFFYRMLPLHEIISLELGVGMNSKSVWKIYDGLINKFGNELNILINVSCEELEEFLGNKTLVDLIILNRLGKIEVKPGYDGLYGVAIINGKEAKVEDENISEKSSLESEDTKLSIPKKLYHNSDDPSKEYDEAMRKHREVQKKLF